VIELASYVESMASLFLVAACRKLLRSANSSCTTFTASAHGRGKKVRGEKKIGRKRWIHSGRCCEVANSLFATFTASVGGYMGEIVRGKEGRKSEYTDVLRSIHWLWADFYCACEEKKKKKFPNKLSIELVWKKKRSRGRKCEYIDVLRTKGWMYSGRCLEIGQFVVSPLLRL